MAEFKVEFNLTGSGSMPMRRADFKEALDAPFVHYTATPYTCDVTVIDDFCRLNVEWQDLTAEQLQEDVSKVAKVYGRNLENLKITPL